VVDINDEMWYTGGTKYDSGIENTPSSQGRVRRAVVNRIRSTDFHAGWTQSKGNAADKFALDESNLCMSIRGARMIKGGEGESVFSTTAALFEPGLYTFSAYIKTTGLTVSSGKKGAFIRVTNYENIHESEAVVESTAAHEINTFADGWQRVYVTFPFLGTPGTTVNVSLVCDASAGTVWFSCPQVEEGEIPNMFNLVMNADFAETVLNTANSTVTRNYPVYWTDIGSNVGTQAANGIVFDRETNLMPENVHGNALRLYSQPRYSNIYMGQMIHAYGEKGDVFVLGGWANTESVQGTYSKSKPSIRYRWSSDDGDTTAYYTDWQNAYFTTENGSWQHMSTTIVAPQKYRRLEIAPGYCYNTCTAMFTHFYLYRDLYGSSFGYDDNGNVVSVKDLSNQQSQATYDDFNNLLSYVQPGSANTEKYTFTYGDTETQKKRHLPLTSATPMGVKSATTYDQYGNSTANVVQPSADAPLMKTETVYSDNGNYVIAQKDARGNSVVNLLDSNGRTVSVTDPAGNSVFYAYDASNRVVGVTSEASGKVHKNSYTYENDRIKTIAHNTTSDTVNDVIYTFEYDELGRKTAVKVGNQELSRNVYSNDRKGLLDEMNFGNGAKVRYVYDDFGRTTAIYVDEPGETSTTPKYEFQYDARGIASVIKDNVLMTETRVTSDLADRPSESIVKDANGNLLHKNVLNYDGKNRVKEFLDILPDSAHKTAYTYDADNRVTEVKFDDSDTHKVNLTYDLLNRVTNRTVTNGVPYSTNYTYVAGDTASYGANATTPLISTITQGSGENAMNFAYTYDSRGNIVSETRNGVTTTYEYDELGQLIRVNDPSDPIADSVHGTTWIITYDRGGNILQKLAYVLTSDAQPSELRQSLIYEYTDVNWKDKLTVFCNDELEYDAIGNLTDDGQWTYTWEKGRQLKSMHNANTGVTMEFKYNHEGIRTQKVKKVNGAVTETTDYVLKGKQIAAMKKNTDTYYFTYDASGKPATVNFNGANYTYVKNLQGDIVGILDASGNLVVEYKYDAWGAPISISSESTAVDDLAFDNPFRYRGYVWDDETGLYYLRSRYYKPTLGRLLNADAICSRHLFAYCCNEPVKHVDPNGKYAESIKSIGILCYNKLRSLKNMTVWYTNAIIDKAIDKVTQNSLTVKEKELVKKHPIAAIKVNEARETACQITYALFGENWNSDDTKENAFKHCLWNALMSYTIGEELAREFGDAHEYGFMDIAPESTKMDFHNNNEGYSLARKLKEGGQTQEFRDECTNKYKDIFETSDTNVYILVEYVNIALTDGTLYSLR